ncbi:MAG: M14 family metallopeptidase [Gammaproteobacteria bacterium]|nr:M14 family metallopeptidase [Gammaproteobacteria bacterium]UCG18127.1 MAG: succinylglutamate desuccinylase/aspartoacylase family protein [Thiotrichales bacterium]HQR96382.1 M14 family metallopeptidase [Thiotrichales bacterium]
MTRQPLVRLASPSRDAYQVDGFRFQTQDKKDSQTSVAIVAGLNGHELAQMHVAAQLVNFLKVRQEADPSFITGDILVVPAVNTFGFNMGERHWPLDKTDINAMFPGFDAGETTQRIAHQLFEQVKGFEWGVELEDRRDQYDCMPYVRMIKSGFEDAQAAKYFGLQFAHYRDFVPSDAGSLQYNWSVWETKSYGLVFGNKQQIHRDSTHQLLDALIRFLAKIGAIRTQIFSGYDTNIVTQEAITLIPAQRAGVFEPRQSVGSFVQKGDLLGKVFDALDGSLKEKIYAPVDGLVTCHYHYPLIYQNTIAYRMISIG